MLIVFHSIPLLPTTYIHVSFILKIWFSVLMTAISVDRSFKAPSPLSYSFHPSAVLFRPIFYYHCLFSLGEWSPNYSSTKCEVIIKSTFKASTSHFSFFTTTYQFFFYPLKANKAPLRVILSLQVIGLYRSFPSIPIT